MLTHLSEVSIRSMVLALVAFAALWALRGRRSAALDHAVWTAVVCGMLALFALRPALPGFSLRILKRAPLATSPVLPAAPAVAAASDTGSFASVVNTGNPSASDEVRRRLDWRETASFAYYAITLAFLARFGTGLFLMRKLLVNSSRIEPGLYESASIAVPLTVGWLPPRILLPVGWKDWDAAKRETVLTHEQSHVRRRDTLVAMLAEVNRCLFWFHPLAWWLERRLALLAEQACDESCIAALGDPRRYARLLIDMAGEVTARGRLNRHGLAMAAASHIRQRIDAILQEGRSFSRGLSWRVCGAVVLCAAPIVLAAAAVRLDGPPRLPQMPIQRFETPTPPATPALLLMAQQRPPAQRAAEGPPFTVFVPVTVWTGGEGPYVTGLEKEAFHVSEDGVEQQVSQFFGANGAVSLAVIYDSSSTGRPSRSNFESFFPGRLNGELPYIRIAGFFPTVDPGDEVFPFASGGSQDLPSALRGAMLALSTGRNPRKAILVETDGTGNGSYDDAVAGSLIREAGVPVYGVGSLVATNGKDWHEPAAAPILRELATRTGGRYFAVDDLRQMSISQQAIAYEIRSQYLLSYSPSGRASSGGWHSVLVRVTPPPSFPMSLAVRIRTGYFR